MPRTTVFRLIASSSFVALVAGSAHAQRAPVAARTCRDCDSVARDSNRVRFVFRGSSLEAELERLATELTANRVQVEVLSRRKMQQIQELTNRVQEEAVRAATQAQVQQLDGKIFSVVRQQNVLRQRLAELCQRVAVPEGWMGVGFEATYRILTPRGDGPVVWRFEDYPTVVTVDDASPAERAGVRRGDRILMIDGHELRDQDIVFAELLKPGERLPLRIERDGRTRDVTLLVERKPPSAEVGCSSVDVRLGTLVREAPSAVVATARAGARGFATPREPVIVMRQPMPPRASATPEAAPAVAPLPTGDPTPVPPIPFRALFPPPAGAVVAQPQGTSSHVAVLGVDLVRLNPGLARRVGVERGVLVVDVARGTPGAEAGLMAGDVIVSANGVAITSPSSIVRAVVYSDDRTAKLGVIRNDAKKPIDIVVTW